MQHSAVASAVVAQLDDVEEVVNASFERENRKTGEPAQLRLRLVQTFNEDGLAAFGRSLHEYLVERLDAPLLTSVEYRNRRDSSGVVRPDYNRPELVIQHREKTNGPLTPTRGNGYVVASED